MITVVPLRFLPGNRWIHIRELCGNDEQSVSGTRSIDAICLLDRIIENIRGSESVITGSATLPVPDRERLLTAVYFNTYGSTIETTVSCSSCNCQFDLNFTINEWIEELTTGNIGKLNGNAYPYLSPDGLTFRLPTGEDEMAVMGLDPSMAETELLKRCIPEGTGNFSPDLLQQAMQEAAPLADTDIETICPECSEKQPLHFNLQQYLLSSLIKEQKKLVVEVHQLTKAYGWGLNEILKLPRSIRRSYLLMVEST